MKNKSTLLIISSAMVMCFLFSSQAYAACTSTQQASFETTGSDEVNINGNTYAGNGFYSTSSINSVIVYPYVKKSGSPSANLKAEIYETSAGLPVGDAICNGTVPAGDISGTAEYHGIELSGCPTLNTGQKYAWVISCLACDSSNKIVLLGNLGYTTYEGGTILYSNNAGDTWSDLADRTENFKIFGCYDETQQSGTTTATTTGATVETGDAVFLFSIIAWIFMIIIIYLTTFFVVLKA